MYKLYDHFNDIQCNLALLDYQGIILFCNYGFSEALDMSAGTLKGLSVSKTPLYTSFTDDFTKESVYLQEITDHYYVVHYIPFENARQNISGVVTLTSTNTLIKEQKMNPGSLLPGELQTIFDLSYDGIFITDGDGYILMVNTAWEKMCGFSRREVVGKRAKDLVAEGKYSQSAAELARITGKTETITLEITEGGRRGQKILATGVPIFDDNGKVWRVVANIRDITTLMEFKTQLEKTKPISGKNTSEAAAARLKQGALPDIIVNSEAMLRTMDMVVRVAETDVTVLLSGETGVGKEVIAQHLHKLSRRSNGPYVKVNCAAIPNTLLESELFGYAPGAFTGAGSNGKTGLFELANGGTLLLDEIGELAFDMQAKILRVLQSKEFIKVGGSKTILTDARIIAATNRDLDKMTKENLFRSDLYFRLNVMNIVIPPLRQRREEIPYLVHNFLEGFNKKHNRKAKMSDETMEVLTRYDWPGNIRELENLIERLVIMTDDVILVRHLPESYLKRGSQETLAIPFAGMKLKQAMDEVERQMLAQSANQYKSTRKMSRVLGVSQSTIVRKMKYHNITAEVNEGFNAHLL